MTGDPHNRDSWHALAHRANSMIVHGVIGIVVGIVGIVMALAIAPSGHVLVTVIWIIFGSLEVVSLLYVGAGFLGRVVWKRRQAVLLSHPPANMAGKSPAIDTGPPAE